MNTLHDIIFPMLVVWEKGHRHVKIWPALTTAKMVKLSNHLEKGLSDYMSNIIIRFCYINF